MSESALVAILKGGLGNQLFIYAACKAAVLRSGRKLYLDTQIAYIADGYGRSYQLDRFGVTDPEVLPGMRIAPNLKHWRHKGLRALNKCLPQNYRTYIAERGKYELLRLRSRADLVYALGYWQSERYFSDCMDQIRNALQLPAPDEAGLIQAGKQLMETHSVALHIRRERFPKVIHLAYYQLAIDEMVKKYPDACFILFGDSVEAVSQQLNFRGRSVVESGGAHAADALLDFWLISRCRHAVLSNSSFAWWAAWFGDAIHPERTVFAPADFGFPMEAASRWLSLPNLIEE